MDNIGFYFVGTFFRGATFFLLSIFLEQICRLKLSGPYSRYLWSGILLIIILPFSLGTFPIPEYPEQKEAIEEGTPLIDTENFTRETNLYISSPRTVVPIQEVSEKTGLGSSLALPPLYWLNSVLLTIGLLLVLKRIHTLYCWKQKLKACNPIVEERLLHLFDDARKLSGMANRHYAFIDGSPYFSEPGCFGFYHPCIFFPARNHQQMTDHEILMLLVHELVVRS